MKVHARILALVAAGLLAGCGGGGDGVFKNFPELQDDDPIVRSDAARRLGDSRAVEAVPALIQLLQQDPDEEVRVTAIGSLEEIGDPSATAPIAASHKDAKHTVRLQVAMTLGKLGDPESIPALQALLYDPDDTVRISAARSLGQIATPESLKVLVDLALIDENELIRGHVVDIIGNMDAKEQIPRVEDALISESNDVRAHAARVLGQLGDNSSVPVLVEALSDPYYKVRSLSAHSLADLAPGDEEAMAAMKARLEEEDNELTKVDIAWSLARGGDRSSIDVIRSSLSKALDDYARAEAARALGEVGEDTDIRLLERALNDKAGLVKVEASKALKKLKEA
ncbi:hypothetical protein ABI59_04205 [Acidobacteria bacterium Mor1]|nr:hypothetical protein ABI59_04205 [Acidobacteria bacterium Mor1]